VLTEILLCEKGEKILADISECELARRLEVELLPKSCGSTLSAKEGAEMREGYPSRCSG